MMTLEVAAERAGYAKDDACPFNDQEFMVCGLRAHDAKCDQPYPGNAAPPSCPLRKGPIVVRLVEP